MTQLPRHSQSVTIDCGHDVLREIANNGQEPVFRLDDQADDLASLVDALWGAYPGGRPAGAPTGPGSGSGTLPPSRSASGATARSGPSRERTTPPGASPARPDTPADETKAPGPGRAEGLSSLLRGFASLRRER